MISSLLNFVMILIVRGFLQEEAGCVLELSDQKSRGFIVQIALPR
jgi:hypothetical protein